MQKISNVEAQFSEPHVFGASGVAVFEYEGVVLVHGQKTFASPRRPKHGHGIGARRTSMPFLFHSLFGNDGRLTGSGAKLAGDYSGDIASIDTFGNQRCGNVRQFGPRCRERAGIVSLIDLIAERYSLTCPELKQVAGGQGPDDASAFIDDPQMPY